MEFFAQNAHSGGSDAAGAASAVTFPPPAAAATTASKNAAFQGDYPVQHVRAGRPVSRSRLNGPTLNAKPTEGNQHGQRRIMPRLLSHRRPRACRVCPVCRAGYPARVVGGEWLCRVCPWQAELCTRKPGGQVRHRTLPCALTGRTATKGKLSIEAGDGAR